ncbi:uncharacterized protein LOC111869033 [Cryptotermes secundus]|uniref:uncharacterized protein LOC111869033 n=1 Tax=Cryptotermes secundus TaxID=105785 RepID=UPI001454B9B8|nr:uncharacterized protein LOC111869033 [Cryptotermes secundus]
MEKEKEERGEDTEDREQLTGSGEWPKGHPLPLPSWGSPKLALSVPNVEQYEDLASNVELTVQQLLQAHNYNSVGNLLRFYEAFRASGESNLVHFYRSYLPPVTPEHYTCVGLALELLRRLSNLETKFPGLTSRLYLASCEESIEDVDGYIREEPCKTSVEKEHVLVALRVEVAGRPGILLLDPGYHIARAVTVMADNLYPHTGWFTQSDEPHCRKEYQYTLTADGNYIIWRDRETRSGLESISIAAVYVGCPFLCPVTVTERRNLVYNFRSLLSRDTKGHLVAGIYFKITDNARVVMDNGSFSFTAFYQIGCNTKRLKVDFNRYLDMQQKSSNDTRIDTAIAICGQQLGLPPGQLEAIVTSLATLLADDSFREQLLGINQDINDVACDN